ncbi:hypothetical protein [Niveibacterium sp. SC-1]|uniref:hypothetical protein n=1 Tax=Niveibacterium sp. SC-1 TaxID=3135646 RepID=UPI00311DB000
MPNPLTSDTLSLKEVLDYYEGGKHRRYALLFAVNGGAFAIAKLLTGEPGKSAVVLGGLSITQLSIGMALFTACMVWDIYAFGEKVRTTYLDSVFGKEGKLVLILLGVLQVAGWLLVGRLLCACG